MSKWIIRIAIPLFTFLLGIATAIWFINQSRKQELRILNPNTRWEKVYFYAINKHASEARLEDLRRVLLPSSDLEVRVWFGFGLTGEDGFILKRSANEWSAIHLGRMGEQPPFTQSQKNLAAPKSGWDRAWQRLVDAGILTLPDAEALHCNPELLDGTSYIVEINYDRTYRSYRYYVPWYDKPQPGVYTPCKEAKQMLAIGKIIAEEYGLERFDLGG